MLGTIIVSILLAAVVGGIIFSMVKTKRAGKHVLSCGGNCSACGCCGSCKFHTQPATSQNSSPATAQKN